PINVGVTGKGHAYVRGPLLQPIEAGAIGMKTRQDSGATSSVIDHALKVADEYDVQIALHSYTLNESGFYEDTMRAINNRVLHMYHTEYAGGGHAADSIKTAAEMNILPPSTNPTMPDTVLTNDMQLHIL